MKIEYGDKLYVIVRKDLSTGAQMAQSLHAALHFADENPDLTKKWMKFSDFICVLHIDNEKELLQLARKAKIKGIICAMFHEPDLDDSLTAVCLEPGQHSKSLCKHLRLAFG